MKITASPAIREAVFVPFLNFLWLLSLFQDKESDTLLEKKTFLEEYLV
jgi:hypothetical protein